MSRPAAVARDAETKVCSACGLEKIADEFYRRSSGYLRGKCKACSYTETDARRKANPEKHAARMRRWRRENHRAWLDASLRNRFGIGIEDYERMWAEQDGRCAVCQCELEPGRNTHVDHDHETKVVRGLLCGLCNRMLGQGRERSAVLRAGAAYLERWDR